MRGGTGGHQYTTAFYWQHMVVEYTGLNLLQVRELDYVQYLILRRDAFIHKLSQTEAGQAYLDNAWRMEQTQPDLPRLRKKLGKEAPSSGS